MEEMIPLVAVVMLFGIPIAAILTAHQRKMAELLNGRPDQNVNPAVMHEIQALRHEVARLQETVHQQAIALDDIRGLARTDMAHRLTETQ
jgi:signal transduction histidine kinase